MQIDITNKTKQFKKGLVEYMLLLVLKKKPQYTGGIIKSFQQAGSEVVEGTLYPLLSRLNKQELITYQWVEAKTGHPRKYYELTKTGKEVLKHLQKEWDTIENTIQKLQK